MNRGDRIFVAGHRGLVGSAVVRELERQGYENLVLKTRSEVDLTSGDAVREFLETKRPTVVIDAAAKVGGILANDTYPADFIRDNLRIQTNLIQYSYEAGVDKFVFLGSSCIYPKMAPQPMSEDTLLTGPLESTNEWYAVAKIAGIKMCQAYRKQYGFDAISLMPTNLYGPGDNFDLQTSHVLPALIRKFHEAKQRGDAAVPIWGTGDPRREFLYVDDLANAVVFLAETYSNPEIVNIGVGEDIPIGDLAELVADVVGFDGSLEYDTSKPDGTPRKLLDVSRLHSLGWEAKWSLRAGIGATYEWYREHGGAA
ncbi:GDP-L-fucose synthase family protein [Lentisalinibacter sediminis]|uniref:GDP-L-fucose synthase family protein n=1 Tax=Lentisalinibacter sediminis TaxID=2992237 RepID=UPI0038669730